MTDNLTLQQPQKEAPSLIRYLSIPLLHVHTLLTISVNPIIGYIFLFQSFIVFGDLSLLPRQQSGILFPITIKYSETVATFRKQLKPHLVEIAFHHILSAVPCSNDDFCLSQFVITPNYFVCCASELEFIFKDIGAIEVLQVLVFK